jgi:uncharacterized protein (TIGR00299 family) protein
VQRSGAAAPSLYVDGSAAHGLVPHHDPSLTSRRSYREIVRVLERAKLADRCARARSRASRRSRARGARARQADREVHFHEVGAVDAIVDLTGAAIGLARLGVTRVTASPPALGRGTVKTEHGLLPLPAPATLELLRGMPTVPAHVAWETVTPTGAALLRTLVDEFCDLPAMTIEAIGHGAGNDRGEGLPNVLRAVLGRAAGAGADRVACLETHLDDLVPEHFEFLMERLFEAGALDVALLPLQMKKNRPGIAVRVLARPSDKVAVAHRLFAESTAIGVRVFEVDRIVLQREIRRVATPYGKIAVKVVQDPEGARRSRPRSTTACARRASTARRCARWCAPPRRPRARERLTRRSPSMRSVRPRRRSRRRLCLHGLTGTPFEVRPLGDALAASGVRAGRTAPARTRRHARGARRARHSEWIDAVESRAPRAARASRARVSRSGSRSAGCSRCATPRRRTSTRSS